MCYNYSFQTWLLPFVFCSSNTYLASIYSCLRRSVYDTIIQSVFKPITKMTFQACSFLLSYTSNDTKVSFTLIAFLEFVYSLLLPIQFLLGLLAVPHNAVFLSPLLSFSSLSYCQSDLTETQICSLLFNLKSFSDSKLPSGCNPSSWIWYKNTCSILPFQSWAGLLCPTRYVAGILHCLVSCWCLALSWLSISHVLLGCLLLLILRISAEKSSLPRLIPQASTIGCLPLFSVHAALWAELNHTNY